MIAWTWTSFNVRLDENAANEGIVEEDRLDCKKLQDHRGFQIHLSSMVLMFGQVDAQRRPYCIHDFDVGRDQVLEVFSGICVLHSKSHAIGVIEKIPPPQCNVSRKEDGLTEKEDHKGPV